MNRKPSSRMPTQQRSGPVIAAAGFLGMGLGGFLDGIILHQILQWHQMISAWLPPDTLEAAKTNMFWDGIFHAGTWTLTAIGVALLWRLAGRQDVLYSNALLAGGLILGWGVFNVMDSVFNHYLFNLHNVREDVPNPQWWNHGFLALGLLQTAAGWIVVKLRGKAAAADR